MSETFANIRVILCERESRRSFIENNSYLSWFTQGKIEHEAGTIKSQKQFLHEVAKEEDSPTLISSARNAP